MKRTIFLSVFILLAIAATGCSDGRQGTNLDIALTDGTHVAGRLVAVDTDWLVLDQVSGESGLPLMLLDYSLVDTVRVPGLNGTLPGAALGGLIGVAGGLFIASGWTFDSATIAKKPTRSLLGAAAGLLAGAAAGYMIGTLYTDSDVVIPQPDSEDYMYLRTRARYPDTIPNWLRLQIDSASEQ